MLDNVVKIDSIVHGNPQPQGGGTLTYNDGDDRRIFLGLKFLIPGFFWDGKFASICLGDLIQIGDFFGY